MEDKENIYEKAGFEEAYTKDVFKLYLSYDNVLADYAHFHPRFEIVQVLEGEIEAVVSGKSYRCRENDFVVVNPFEVHFYERKTKVVNAIVLVVDEIYLHDFHNYYGKKQIDYHLKTTKVSDKIKMQMRELLVAWKKDGVDDMLLNFSRFNFLLSLLVKEYPLKLPSAVRLDIRDALDYIHKHYKEDLTMEKVAHKMGYSKEYFSGEFNKFMGINFRSYLNKVRLEKAQILLKNKNKNVTEIVSEVGFANTAMYYRALKKYRDLLETPPTVD